MMCIVHTLRLVVNESYEGFLAKRAGNLPGGVVLSGHVQPSDTSYGLVCNADMPVPSEWGPEWSEWGRGRANTLNLQRISPKK